MRSVLFIDDVCPKPYDSHTLHSTSQGGTESSVSRIAAELGAAVEQHCREEGSRTEGGAEYLPAGFFCGQEATHVVCLRIPETLYRARERFPEAKLYMWSTDLYSKEGSLLMRDALRDTKAEGIVALTEFHRGQIQKCWPDTSYPKIWSVPLPLDPIIPTLKTRDYNPHQLVWFSSPHKGLKRALEIFAEIHKRDPRFTLVVHNPGYMADAVTDMPGVIIKPRGSYVDSLRTVASSLCVFYPNLVFPETFGLVFAESAALGTPVLTHNLGAASEVLDHPQEIVDCRNTEKVIERVFSWSQGARPLVKARQEFRLERVLKSWEKLLG